MTAQVEPLIRCYPDVVVPVQTVASHNDNKHVYREAAQTKPKTVDPEAPPMVIESNPDPEAPPTVDPNEIGDN
ncbi:hypothetical protein [Mariniblastus fucicola]|uniref:Uncharacterized protein n=1 Tax=Mariniblastus fucicola TaxID=980251 RepID=A0A5B9P3Z6_9BACT|nr:hypothetical protein [Mariniblastus fucicola]QEG21128.1 hypothetical protein MFFC18_09820 [Mariniblastus fucicola]